MIEVLPAYEKLYTTNKRIILETGGRGSGKSYGTSTFIERLTFENGHVILYTRYTMINAETSVIPEVLEKIELDNTGKYFYVTKKEIENTASGSKILFRGIKTSQGNQTANLKSIQGLTTFIVDEAEEWVSKDDFEKLSLSIRTKGVKNRIIIIMNPTDCNHWVYTKYIQNSHKIVNIDGVDVQISTHPDVEHIHTTYLDNIKNLDEDFLREIKNIKNESLSQANQEEDEIERKKVFNSSKYAQKIIGRWADQKEGVIFTYSEGKFDDSLPFCFGQDYGFSNDPTTLVKIAVDKKRKKVYWKECFVKKGIDNTKELFDLNFGYTGGKNLIMADGHEKLLIIELKRKGLNITGYLTPPNGVREGILTMREYEHIIEPESHNIKNEFNNYTWSDKKAEIPIDDFNHCIDAGRYAFKRLTKKSRKITYGNH